MLFNSVFEGVLGDAGALDLLHLCGSGASETSEVLGSM